ncbi:endonuclease VIII [Candidatus Dojkabacteria bacterium]|nr:endonuclease VIII [Candidatus Dojkabacteria bacterium]
MIELPEAKVLSEQLTKSVKGKTVATVIANQSPHKFAWFKDDPKDYSKKLSGGKVLKAEPIGGYLQVKFGEATIVFGEGINLRFLGKDAKRPPKHQLLLEFADGTALCASVQMYGGLWLYTKSEKIDNKYITGAIQKPSPYTKEFTKAYFDKLINDESVQKLSIKAFLATEQRIPGLGNGVLQDILYNAKLHPKQKIMNLSNSEKSTLFKSVTDILLEMATKGGRDVETDLFGNPGGFICQVSKNTVGKPCPKCKSKIVKLAYMGGSVYFCPDCQKETVSKRG